MDIDNEKSNKTYKLYKQVFNNKFLSNSIYRNVYKFNQQITDCYSHGRSLFKYCVNYQEATLDWIISNKKYSLLFDKIKSNHCFNKTELSFDHLIIVIKQIMNLENDCSANNNNNNNNSGENDKENKETNLELLKQFFKINSNNLFNIKLNHPNLTYYRDINLIEFAIHTQYNKIIFKNNGGDNDDDDYLDLSLKIGNLEIIKFIHKEMGITCFKDKLKALHFSLMSENRNKVVEYLLDEIKYQPPTLYSGIFDKFFENLIQLEFKLFKRLYQLGSPILYHSYAIPYLINEKFNDTLNDSKINFKNKLLDFIQCSIFVCSLGYFNDKFNKNIDYNSLLLKIEKILNSNNLETTSSSSSSSSSTIFSKFKNIFIDSTNNNNNKNNKNNNNNNNEIDYFIEKEIKRIFIFEFLVPLDFIKRDVLCMKVIDFAREYGEYNLLTSSLDKFKNQTSIVDICTSILKIANFNSDSKLINFLENNYFNHKELVSFLKINDKVDEDTSLVYYISNINNYYNFDNNNNNNTNINNNNNNKFENLFDTKKIKIQDQIQYLSIILKNSINSLIPNRVLLQHILLNNEIGIVFENIEQIMNVISGYNSKIWNEFSEISKKNLKSDNFEIVTPPLDRLFSAVLFVGNKELFKFIFRKYKDYFKWDSQIIGIKVVRSNDLDFIQFLFDNDIGNLKFSINFCTNRVSIKYMTETLGLYFSEDLLVSICENQNINNWNSNYIFNYILNFKINNLNHYQYVVIPQTMKNYKYCKSIEINICNGSLLSERVKIINNSTHFNRDTMEKWFFENTRNIAKIIALGNYYHLVDLLNEIEQYSNSFVGCNPKYIFKRSYNIAHVGIEYNPKIKNIIKSILESLNQISNIQSW
ncbi:hypothetical protein DDB_G0285701 [Dictyostelium discoideum AX4]|uniref:Uncharacterized protein n=1 Tax=Dictyostelium discoideum TaxID=44689 RepID=Q54MS0_DICDI|nr:hypothetical protein DDB_G0285701 [Dictyostelium discoideum AX4]EAL64688.1 hypothetical protein DDB_G0285701 [Dictyostelium discoideum AX4]|eukprot:XP_638223.1 hypothetical protein DDB_G0285701 [Dictyostelium discoideum AX4]